MKATPVWGSTELNVIKHGNLSPLLTKCPWMLEMSGCSKNKKSGFYHEK